MSDWNIEWNLCEENQRDIVNDYYSVTVDTGYTQMLMYKMLLLLLLLLFVVIFGFWRTKQRIDSSLEPPEMPLSGQVFQPCCPCLACPEVT